VEKIDLALKTIDYLKTIFEPLVDNLEEELSVGTNVVAVPLPVFL
jgi:hypothetical protein